jgi:NitT/TauT family transport system substrate-binding protein
VTLTQTRRQFLGTTAVGAAAAALPDLCAFAAEPPPETTTVRLSKFLAICFAPQYVCEELLRDEGFTQVRYVDLSDAEQFNSDTRRVDFLSNSTVNHVGAIDTGSPIAIVSPVHAGCYELFARGGIRAMADLKGKSVGGIAVDRLISIFTTWIGLDPKKDLTIVSDPAAKPFQLFLEGKLDAYLGFPPEPQELRARNAGHVILRTAVDRPWSQYLCCTLAGNREYVRNHPVATKRVVRALLKAADLCANQPEASAQLIADRGFTRSYDYALEALREIPYGQWPDYDAEDSVRFYALRLHELGMIKHDPKRILADGTDFRFFDEVKRELKA